MISSGIDGQRQSELPLLKKIRKQTWQVSTPGRDRGTLNADKPTCVAEMHGLLHLGSCHVQCWPGVGAVTHAESRVREELPIDDHDTEEAGVSTWRLGAFLLSTGRRRGQGRLPGELAWTER